MSTKPEFVPVRTIVLVGFMAAGKTTVGRILASQLGWSFRDLDDEIERHTGSTVREFFRTRGEPAFRELERRLVAGLLDQSETVVAPGGGWAASPGALASLPAAARAVWLKVSAREAVRRATRIAGSRPLLDVADPLATAERLLAEREPCYALAQWHVEVDTRTPDEIVTEILKLHRKNSR
jgi:shikimate kinase